MEEPQVLRLRALGFAQDDTAGEEVAVLKVIGSRFSRE
jgi:hypothetical protein